MSEPVPIRRFLYDNLNPSKVTWRNAGRVFFLAVVGEMAFGRLRSYFYEQDFLHSSAMSDLRFAAGFTAIMMFFAARHAFKKTSL